MTEANQKRLYDHFMKEGLLDRAEELLKVYPHFKGSKPAKEEPAEKNKKN